MNNYCKENLDPHEKAMLEVAQAENAKNKANIDYVAMMADIEIPTEGGNEDE